MSSFSYTFFLALWYIYTLPWHPYPGFLLSFLGSSKPVWTSLLRGTLVVVLTTAPIPGDAGWVSEGSP